jgi:uncharacterized protein with HEPN domain
VFGSVARSEDLADSDVDFLVECAPGASILDQIHLENDLRELLGCSVDVIPIGALKPRDAHVIAEACEALGAVVAARKASLVDQRILLRAAERLLEIIGEAATECSASFRANYPEVDWTGIAGLRIVLAHHYHRTQPDLIWTFAEVEAPKLGRLLAEGDAQSI